MSVTSSLKSFWIYIGTKRCYPYLLPLCFTVCFSPFNYTVCKVLPRFFKIHVFHIFPLKPLHCTLNMDFSCCSNICYPLEGDCVTCYLYWHVLYVKCNAMNLLVVKKNVCYVFLGEAFDLDWICNWEALPQSDRVHDQGGSLLQLAHRL